jgi:lipopolysaccharide transport system ATP-binding protein
MDNIFVHNVGKKYKRYKNQWARLAEIVTRKKYVMHEERWALRGVSFSVHSGEAVGIVGQNGAGKSTLLKILTGTTKPTEGEIQIEGRVAALLELGMGFHTEFTGRENAIMTCKMSGLNNEQIRLTMPDIVGFSELGDYIDQPLRVYSSGMQMRLAFSATTALRPDILIVDEALAVGDAYFQHKCINRIRDYKNQGTTLLFVSHDPNAIKTLCNRAILFEGGVLLRDGASEYVLDYYNAMIAQKSKNEEIRQIENEFGRTSTRSGKGEAFIQRVEMIDKQNKLSRAFRVGDKAQIKVCVSFNSHIEDPTVGIAIRDRLGNDVFGTNTYHLKANQGKFYPDDIIEVNFKLKLNLGYGNYSLCAAVHSNDTHLEDNYDWWDQALVFQVIPDNSHRFIGTSALPVDVEIIKKEINE